MGFVFALLVIAVLGLPAGLDIHEAFEDKGLEWGLLKTMGHLLSLSIVFAIGGVVGDRAAKHGKGVRDD